MTSVINHLFNSVPGSLLWVHGFVAQEVALLNLFIVYALKYFQKKTSNDSLRYISEENECMRKKTREQESRRIRPAETADNFNMNFVILSL